MENTMDFNQKQVKYLNTLCAKFDAYGFEVWHIGVRFYLNNGKMSRIFSNKLHNYKLPTATVWIKQDAQFKQSLKSFYKRNHPDVAADSKWSTSLCQFVQENLVYERDSRYLVCGGYRNPMQSQGYQSCPEKEVQSRYPSYYNERGEIDAKSVIDNLKRRQGKRYRQF